MPDLSLPRKAQRLRIYVGESDRWRGKPLEIELLEVMRKEGMAGATAFRGVAGFGAHSAIHTARIEVLSMDLPVVVEAVDTPEKIQAILPVVYPMVREGLITLEDVQIIKYTQRLLNPLPADKPVSEAMTRDVVTLTPELPIHQAWKRMLEHLVKAAPVVDLAGKVIGILTDGDLLERGGIRQRLSVAVRMDGEEIRQELAGLEASPVCVADLMSHPVITVQENEALGAATARMVKSGLKRLPVVNPEGKLVGILSRLDILRLVASAPQAAPAAHLPAGSVKTVRDVMSAQIPMVKQEDDLATLIDKFVQAGTHRLIVVDGAGKAIGLVSDSDVVARVQPDRRHGILEALRKIGKPPAGKETAFDLMSPGVLTAGPDLPVTGALKMMLAGGRKWLVVQDETGKPFGLVDRKLMLEALIEIYEQG
jgi:CBS domain-containing protein